MVLRGSFMHVVSPPFRLPQRLYDRFPLLFLLLLPEFSILLLLPTPVVYSAPPPPNSDSDHRDGDDGNGSGDGSNGSAGGLGTGGSDSGSERGDLGGGDDSSEEEIAAVPEAAGGVQIADPIAIYKISRESSVRESSQQVNANVST